MLLGTTWKMDGLVVFAVIVPANEVLPKALLAIRGDPKPVGLAEGVPEVGEFEK